LRLISAAEAIYSTFSNFHRLMGDKEDKMKLSNAVKIIIGILSAWEVLSPVFLVLSWFFFFFSLSVSETQGNPSSDALPFLFIPLLFLATCSSFLFIGLHSFYIIHIILNKTGTDLLRAIFGIGLVIFPFLAIPFYYFIYILPENPPNWALAPVSR
jgi:cytochrome c biogenesis protein CcdA